MASVGRPVIERESWTDLQHLHADRVLRLWSVERDAVHALGVDHLVEVCLGGLYTHFYRKCGSGRRRGECLSGVERRNQRGSESRQMGTQDDNR